MVGKLVRWLAALALVLTAFAINAQGYPSRPIHVLVPVAAGSGIDNVARIVSESMSRQLGQPIVVENKPGAAHILAMSTVAKAIPDGYTLLFAGAPIALNSALGMQLPYDPVRDFTPISLLVSVPAIIVVHPSTPYRSISDIVRGSKQDPKGLSYAVASMGSITHLLGEALRQKTGANLVVVAYKGSSDALSDVVSGRVPVFLDAYIPTGPLVVDGKLRAIAIASTRRSPLLPDVPTVSEQGFPDLVGSGFFGLVGPANVPGPVVNLLHTAAIEAIKQNQEKLMAQGYEIQGTGPEDYARYIAKEVERWTPIVKSAGIK